MSQPVIGDHGVMFGGGTNMTGIPSSLRPTSLIIDSKKSNVISGAMSTAAETRVPSVKTPLSKSMNARKAIGMTKGVASLFKSATSKGKGDYGMIDSERPARGPRGPRLFA